MRPQTNSIFATGGYPMGREKMLNDFWLAEENAPPPAIINRDALPSAARRYNAYAIAKNAPRVAAVKLRMHGEIKLNGWLQFEAEQVIRPSFGMIWCASVRVFGMTISGYDRLQYKYGEMKWRLMGLLPIMVADGHDVSRSANGRMAAELIWLPPALFTENVRWSETEDGKARAEFSLYEVKTALNLKVDPKGKLEEAELMRWGKAPGEEEYGYHRFGAIIERMEQFSAFRIPSQIRAGWHFGTDEFESKGEFFRAKIDHAEFALMPDFE